MADTVQFNVNKRTVMYLGEGNDTVYGSIVNKCNIAGDDRAKEGRACVCAGYQ